jgi:hypothetical protein
MSLQGITYKILVHGKLMRQLQHPKILETIRIELRGWCIVLIQTKQKAIVLGRMNCQSFAKEIVDMPKFINIK